MQAIDFLSAFEDLTYGPEVRNTSEDIWNKYHWIATEYMHPS